jgi:hypothetical protein
MTNLFDGRLLSSCPRCGRLLWLVTSGSRIGIVCRDCQWIFWSVPVVPEEAS